MMKKKVLCMLLTLVALTATACGGDGETAKSDNDATEEMVVREDIDGAVRFDVPVIESSLPCIFEMVGRNAAFPDKVNDVLSKYPVAKIEE